MDRASPGCVFLITLLTGLQERVTVDCQDSLDGPKHIFVTEACHAKKKGAYNAFLGYKFLCCL